MDLNEKNVRALLSDIEQEAMCPEYILEEYEKLIRQLCQEYICEAGRKKYDEELY